MKYNDKVRVLVDRSKYLKENIHQGDIGWINLPEIRFGTFEVLFETNDEYENVNICEIYVGDLEVVEESTVTDEQLLSYLCKNDPRWWCKVEGGYIINLKGERKNKIPYKYDS
ncbi:MAG: hypothetical protein NC132_04745 [Corallococcus sp.]|nr:hypothetical protein [Corallococcus sp.]MCM1359695.1 hypothetical protein [Corallococcus sp.]MCM1395404.1 hypothetical protein [Corallococcus sp.]